MGVTILRRYGHAKQTTPQKGLAPVKKRLLDDYTRSHLTDALMVTVLAALCDLSPSHFMHAFTLSYGEPPHRHIIKLRVKSAANMLRITELSIAQVAYHSGFSSQSHLTAAMRKWHGATPGSLRSFR